MPDFFVNLGSIIWYTLTIVIFISYLFALFSIVGDLFRDRDLSGGMKAVWIFFLIVFPFITALIYLIARGGGMAERAQAQAKQAKEATDDYIRSVAGSPADEIARAKGLLDAGTITTEEYTKLKAKALA
ncbi:PLDc N-terminal domain-containing protein [Propionicimonas sp.]|uniref:PLDc N-terminal domain-containing protein n=1 Tax=Propionicimonas sp. TaxID=1955623 RepID=UPI0039E4F601